MTLSTEDRLDIQALVNTYCRATSAQDFDRLATLFTDDAIWERVEAATSGLYTEQVRVDGRENNDFIAKYRELADLSFEMQGDQIYQYVAANHVIVPGDNPNDASGDVTLILYGISAEKGVYIVMIGNFHDEYRRTEKGWRIRYRGIRIST